MNTPNDANTPDISLDKMKGDLMALLIRSAPSAPAASEPTVDAAATADKVASAPDGGAAPSSPTAS